MKPLFILSAIIYIIFVSMFVTQIVRDTLDWKAKGAVDNYGSYMEFSR